MRRLLLPLAVLFVCGTGRIVLAADVPPPIPLDRILVVVNNGIITESALAVRMDQVSKQLEAQHITPPPRHVLRSQVLKRMILDRIQMQFAARLGIKVNDSQVDQAMRDLASRNRMTTDQFTSALAKDGINVPQFRRQLRTQIVIRQLIEREIRPRVRVSDREVGRYLRRERTLGQRAYKLKDLFVGINQTRGRDVVQKAAALAETLAKKLKSGVSFSELAIAYSQGPHALSGGDLGWKKAAQLPPVFLKALETMHPGDVSKPLQIPDGFHLIKLIKERTTAPKEIVTQTLARHILLKPNAVSGWRATLVRMERIRNEIKRGAHFGALAREYSNDSLSAALGGGLGWLNPGELDPSVEAAMGSLNVGQVSAPIRTAYGIELIQVLGRRQRDISSLVGTYEARRALQAHKASELYNRWLHQLRDEAYVRFLTKDIHTSS